MLKYKRIFSVILVLLFTFLPINNRVFAESNATEPGKIMVSMYGNKVVVSGKLNEKNDDITIIAYRSGDNAISYIDQGKTNGDGEFSFDFNLPNGTYKAKISSNSGQQYTTENIVVYKAPGPGEEPEEISVIVNESKVVVSGKLNEKNEDITILVNRSSDNAISYIDQGKTDGNGEFSFDFNLPNGTYIAKVSSNSGQQYTTGSILVYKAPGPGEEPEEINVMINENKVVVSGKLNEKNENITIIAYRNSDNAKSYFDQGKTDGNGEFSFDFNLPNGTYTAIVRSRSGQYTTGNIVVFYTIPEVVNATISPISGVYDKNLEKQKDVTTNIIWNNAEQVIDVKVGAESIGSHNYNVTNSTLTIKKEYLATKELGNLLLTVEFNKGEPSTLTIDITKTISGGGGGGIVKPTVPVNIIQANKDGTISENGITIVFPANAFTMDFQVTLKRLANTANLFFKDNEKLLSDVFEITKDKIGSFSKPVSITLTFNKNLVDTNKYKISIYWLDETTNKWIELDEVIVYSESGQVKGNVTHFTKFAVIATEKLIEMPDDIVGHWAEGNIKQLINLGAIASYPDNTFRPNRNITRAEFATILVKAFGLKSQTEKVFADTENHWAKDFISIAADNGIIVGYGDNMFGPNDLITREQMAVMIVKTMKLDLETVETSLLDKDQISDWAGNYVSSAIKAKVIVGYPDGTFKPKENATRAEAVTVIVNGLRNIAN